MNNKANGKYMTWWNEKRIKNKVKYSELLELLELKKGSMSHVCGCFIGKEMPNDDLIAKIANIFDVPFEEAKSHFFNDWAGSKSKKVEYHSSDDYGYSEKVIKDLSYKDPDHGGYGYVNNLVDEAVNYVSDDEPEEIEEPIDISRERELIMAQIYGKVDYNTFILIKDQLFIDTDEVLKFIYGQVDFETYEKIHKAMEEI